MSVVNVVKPLHVTAVFKIMKKIILKRNSMNYVSNMVTPLYITVISENIKHKRIYSTEYNQDFKVMSQLSLRT